MSRQAGAERCLIVRPLGPERIDEAYPLVRAAMPALSLESWREFARKAVDRPAEDAPPGIMFVESCQGYIHGVCTYRVRRDIRHGPVLVIEELVTMDLVDSAPVAEALIAALEARAREFGCATLQMHVHDGRHARKGGDQLQDLLQRNGHRLEAVRLVKRVGEAPK